MWLFLIKRFSNPILACKLFFTIKTSYGDLFVDFFDVVHLYNSFYKNYSYKIQKH